MNDSKISVRYSKALFQSAVEKNLLDKVFQDMNYISELCRMDEIKGILLSPVIVPSKKKAIFFSLLGKNVDKLTISLVDLLITNGRESFLPAVARVFRDETLKFRGITETILVTAIPVDEKTKKEITDLVSEVFDTKAELNETVDESIIGGFILKVNDNYIDASIKSKLRTIRKGLSVRVTGKEK